MYQINSNQIGGRLSNADKERVNGVITKLQEATGETPQSFKELFLLMVDSIEKQMNNEVDNSELSNDNTDNNTENNVISLIFSKDAFSQIQESALKIGLELPDNTIDVGSLTALASQITPQQEPEIKEVEKKVTVDRELSENEILIELDDDQLNVAKEVQQNRGRALQNQGAEMETLPELFRNCFFTEGNLVSFGGGWFTGM